MNITRTISLMLVLLGSSLLTAVAQDAPRDLDQRFKQLDRDSNGKLTPAEFPDSALFKRLDLNADGEVTMAEATKAFASDVAEERNEPSPTVAPVLQGPRPLKGGDHGVGRLVPDDSFTDLNGTAHKLSELTKNRLVVIAMTSTSCPLSKKYLPTLVELAKTSGDGVAWLIVNPIATDKSDELKTAASRFGGNAMYIQDRDGQFAKSVGGLTTTDVIVLDASRTVVYHGAIDDQYGFGYSIETPRHSYLADALAAIKTGHQPLISATDAPGCTLQHSNAAIEKTAVTYHNRISRIVQRNCAECHREGGVGPFSLTTYDDVEAHIGMVQQVVERGIMPPWFAVESPPRDKHEVVHSPWANDRSLAQAEKQDLLKWIAAGSPVGDPRDAPQPLQFADGWLIGKPDAVYQFAEPVAVKATGFMPYQYIDVETNLAEDKWVQAIEVKPGDREVVHHVLVFAQGVDESDGERDGYWGIYVPGNSATVYPDGFAKRLPKGAKLRFQMHYTPNGSATTDRTSIGVIFAKQPPQHEVRVAGISNRKLSIPPGEDNHHEVATLLIPTDARVLGFLPHMHLRGKACRYELTKPNGETTTLLDIPRYDFNWQLLYRYFEPLSLRGGDTLRFTAWYDNSSKNPANPDPTKTVRWGDQTYEEMQLGYIEYYYPNADPSDPDGGDGDTDPSGNALFRHLDINRDGMITRAEVRQQMPDDAQASGPVFDRLDADQDGKLDKSEFDKL